MKKSDIILFLKTVRHDLDEDYIDNVCFFLLYHLEEKIRREVLDLDEEYGPGDIILPPPYDEIYWRYILTFFALTEGKIDEYKENQKLFEAAWDNFCRQVFRQKENFRLNSRLDEQEEGV